MLACVCVRVRLTRDWCARVCVLGRGTVLADVNDDGLLDIVYGNWLGPHRMLIQVTLTRKLTLTLNLNLALTHNLSLTLNVNLAPT